MFKFDSGDLDSFIEELKEKSNQVEELSGEHVVDFEDLFPMTFMTEHTPYSDIYEFLKDGGFNCTSMEVFEQTPEILLDKYVSNNSDFSSWEEMHQAAADNYFKTKLDW